jgi:hypothetical protein
VTPNRGRKALSTALPAPVGGLNAHDALAAMPVTDASVMVNLFPYADRVETRPGYSAYATSAAVSTGIGPEGFNTLMTWHGAASTVKLATYNWSELVGGISRGRLRVVSFTSGSVVSLGELVSTGGSSNLNFLGDWCEFTAASGTHYVVIPVSQQTAPAPETLSIYIYDGSSLSTTAITGLPTEIIGAQGHRNRLWFYGGANAALTAYYLPPGAISGAVVAFNLGPFAKKGGGIATIRTWTIDGGDGGLDDLIMFVTTQGEVILYSGIDPGSTATWNLVGAFDLGAIGGTGTMQASGGALPSGQNSIAMRWGSDVVLNLASGVGSAKRALQGQTPGDDYTISTKIRPLFVAANQTYGPASGARSWRMAIIRSLHMLMVSVPAYNDATAAVYAMNTETGAWTKFTGPSMVDIIEADLGGYFIDGTKTVWKFDGSDVADNGAAITFECRQAYNYFNSPNNKLVTLMQPMLRSTGDFSLTVRADADFNAGTISSYTGYTVSVAQNLQPWLSPSAYGRAIATHLQGQTSVGVVSWYATNYAYESSGLL